VKNAAIQYLLPKDQQYLSKLLGFMGPKFFLEPWFKFALKWISQDRGSISKDFKKQGQIVWEMECIELCLALLAQAGIMGESIKVKINDCESKLVSFFGSCDEFKRALAV
jgi:hypothetical protein